MSKRGLRKNKPPPLTAMFGGEIRRFRSCHHHMADGNFHSDSLLVKWEGSPTPVSTSAPPPPPPATAVLHAATVGKTPTLTHLFLTFLFFFLLTCTWFAGQFCPSHSRSRLTLVIYLIGIGRRFLNWKCKKIEERLARARVCSLLKLFFIFPFMFFFSFLPYIHSQTNVCLRERATVCGALPAGCCLDSVPRSVKRQTRLYLCKK